MTEIDWVGLDWGTSNLRAYAIDSSGAVVDELQSNQGMNVLKPGEFEEALINLIEPWLGSHRVMSVYACGMVGARQGWQEAAYRSVPCQPVSGQGLTKVLTSDPRIEVRILPGLSQSSPADVMRGEETQIAGLLATEPNFDGAICLPGTHSKWVSIANGEIVGFHTFMTGELFSLISSQSVLRHSVSEDGDDRDAFLNAARASVQQPNITVQNMFGVRASSLLSEVDPNAARARLSGMLIGQEIGVAKDLWNGRPVTIIGSSSLSNLYADILGDLNVPIQCIEAKDATLSGLGLAVSQTGKAA